MHVTFLRNMYHFWQSLRRYVSFSRVIFSNLRLVEIWLIDFEADSSVPSAYATVIARLWHSDTSGLHCNMRALDFCEILNRDL